ncbi:MAG: hypothetical protein GXP55_10040 [Deltaproteobacteria bacterium]|nr:hypothetical protein [Deltaproteobacteria bacterium]
MHTEHSILGLALPLLAGSLIAGCAAAIRPAPQPPGEREAALRPQGAAEHAPLHPPEPTATAEDIWRPPASPAPWTPWAFRLTPIRASGLVLEVTGDDSVYYYMEGRRPSGPAAVRLRDYSIRQTESGLLLFQLKPDGTLVDTVTDAYLPQDLHCHFTLATELVCRHDSDGSFRGVDMAVTGANVVSSMEGVSITSYTVDPPPESDEQRRRVLFLVASYLIDWDTASHDGDTTFE